MFAGQQYTRMDPTPMTATMELRPEDLDAAFDEEGMHIPEWVDNVVGLALPKAHSMDVANDPRFFESNVVEKRLSAFSGLSMIASLTTGTALGQCFKLSKNIEFDSVAGIFQVFGFYTMALILFLSLTSTIVFVYQGFFTYRLITAGPTGFELAMEYYLADDMVRWRHYAVKCLGFGLPLMFFATGCMLYVAFWNDRDEQRMVSVHGVKIAPVGMFTFVVFAYGSFVLLYIGMKHDQIFRAEYNKAKDVQDFARSVSRRSQPSPRNMIRRA